MTPAFSIIVKMYFVVLLVVVGALVTFAAIVIFYTGHTGWAEAGVEKLLSIIEVIVGAALGSLSTAVAFTFSKNGEPTREDNSLKQ